MTLVREYQPTFVLGDGETKEFSYLFEEVSENFIKVVVKHSDDSTYVPVFSVDLDSHKVVFGESETAPLDTDLVCIYRNTPDLQDTPFRTLQGYDAKALENILSKIVAMIQELKANGFSTQRQLDLLHPADDGASVVVDYNARILKKGLYFQIVNGNLQVSADGNSFIKMPKSADITEFRRLETVLEDLTVIYRLQYKVDGVWYDADSYTGEKADEAIEIAKEARTIATGAKEVADEAKEIAEGIDGKAQQALDNSVEALETAEEAKEMIQDKIIVRSATMPTPSADLVGKNYQYAGTTNAQYTHNYIYECQTVENNTLAFTPDTVSCSWNNLSAFLSQQTPDYNSVVKGTLTYVAAADLWQLVARDADDNTVLSYQQYTGDWEAVGFTFAGSYEDGDVVSFERNTTTTYAWVRVNVQPDYTTEIQELETDVDNIQAVIPEQATPTNQLVTQNTTTQMQQQINHLQTIGRFLSFWDATTGLAQTNPQTSPYVYQTGDYFRVGVVASGGGTNYKPSGSSYTIGVASTVVETEPLTEGQVYYYDGANWALAAGGSVAIDGATIVFNSNNEIQAVATVNQNPATGATNPVYNWVGTLAEYQAQNIETLHPDWLCCITDDVSGGDSVYTKAQVDEKFQEKATAVNYNNITNCLTHIPQDIKLELNNGRLTLKAGSKVYVPNGPGVFDVVTIPNDINAAFSGSGTTFFLFWNEEYSSYITGYLNGICHSGTSVPANYSGLFFDTTSNTVDMYQDGIAQGRRYSLPLGRVELSANGTITKIEYIFNGFGYIGSTVFALPGVKGLIPNGRNADGTLKNIEVTVNNVLTHTGSYNDHPQWIVIYSDSISAWDSVDWIGYNSQENILFNKEDSSSATSGSKIVACVGAFLSADENQKITAFTPKQVFHAVDYNDTEYIAHQAMPSSRYINLTLGASGSTYTAPANGWFFISAKTSGTNYQIRMRYTGGVFAVSSRSDSLQTDLLLPVRKGKNCVVDYDGLLSNVTFRFVYAEGAQ